MGPVGRRTAAGIRYNNRINVWNTGSGSKGAKAGVGWLKSILGGGGRGGGDDVAELLTKGLDDVVVPKVKPRQNPGKAPAAKPKKPTKNVDSGNTPKPANSGPASAGNVIDYAAKFEDGAFQLIGANRATIDPRKLTEYALNPNHPVGGNKARVFESALGFNRSNADDLMVQLRRGVMENTPIPGKVDKWGTRFTVDIPITGPAGSGIVRTGWIYTPGSTTPSLNTLMVR